MFNILETMYTNSKAIISKLKKALFNVKNLIDPKLASNLFILFLGIIGWFFNKYILVIYASIHLLLVILMYFNSGLSGAIDVIKKW